MALPDANDLTNVINLAQEVIDFVAPIITILSTSDPGEDHTALIYEAKALALKNACLMAYNAKIDVALYPLSPFSVLVFGFDQPG